MLLWARTTAVVVLPLLLLLHCKVHCSVLRTVAQAIRSTLGEMVRIGCLAKRVTLELIMQGHDNMTFHRRAGFPWIYGRCIPYCTYVPFYVHVSRCPKMVWLQWLQ